MELAVSLVELFIEERFAFWRMIQTRAAHSKFFQLCSEKFFELHRQVESIFGKSLLVFVDANEISGVVFLVSSVLGSRTVF